MLQRLGWILLVFLMLGSVVGTLVFLYVKAMEPPEVFDTGSAKVVDIVKKTVATGAIVPRNEVEIKSRVSGILDHLAVEPGDTVQRGDLIARIKVVPDPTSLQRAATAVRTARLNLREAERLFDEDSRLYEMKAIPGTEFLRRRNEVDQRREEYRAAQAELTLVREGALRNAEAIATDIRSTVEGMVLAVDVKLGTSITEINTFSEGTTIAEVADMNDMVFEGMVDESEVGRIRQGMPLEILVGALDNRRLKGELEYISPKGLLEEGTVQFEIRASIRPEDGLFVRAGSSANANIVLDRRDQVLAINEGWVKFEDRKPFVEVETGSQVFERRDVELGLSDGLMVEVISGVSPEDRIKGRPRPR
ncbi:MAG: efflux RND transporter periplasmic adaptor subunit [Deltaproteobacteria bacterium]|nr:MAG: efflux RND transporter periplasmic adaptor subunit [Deltaproteobacteria bacterium]